MHANLLYFGGVLILLYSTRTLIYLSNENSEYMISSSKYRIISLVYVTFFYFFKKSLSTKHHGEVPLNFKVP